MQHLLILALGVFFAISAQAQPAVSAGRYHNLALTADGTVLWWGEHPSSHELRQRAAPSYPQRVDGVPPAIAIAAGWSHSSAITRDGDVYEWGFSPYRIRQVFLMQPLLGPCAVLQILSGGHGRDPCREAELARKTRMLLDKPKRIPGLPPAVAIAASDASTVIISRTGEVYCWNQRSFPVKIEGLERIKAVALGQFHGVALRDDGVVFGFGSGSSGGISYRAKDDAHLCSNPDPRPFFTGAIAIAAGHADTYALRADGSLWAWGSTWSDKPNLPKDANPDSKPDQYVARRVATLEGAIALGGGSQPSALTERGALKSWKIDIFNPSKPTPGLLGGIVAVASDSSVLALRRDGFLCTMGWNMGGTTMPGDKAMDIKQFVALPAAEGQAPLNLIDPTRAAPPDLCVQQGASAEIASGPNTLPAPQP